MLMESPKGHLGDTEQLHVHQFRLHSLFRRIFMEPFQFLHLFSEGESPQHTIWFRNRHRVNRDGCRFVRRVHYFQSSDWLSG
jgi:hypothetical protein